MSTQWKGSHHVRKGYVDTTEGQIHYRYAGESNRDRSPIVIMHQNVCSSALFNEVIDGLSDEYYVVALDTPGFGLSYTPEEVPDISYWTHILTEALDNLDIDSFHAFGQHTGASIAVDMANNDPNRVETVILMGPLYLDEETRMAMKEDWDGSNAAPPIDETGEYLQETWKYVGAMGAGETLEMQHRAVIDALLARDGSRLSYAVVWDQDFPSLFENIQSPRMVMGCEGDALWEGFKTVRDNFESVKAVEVSGDNFEPVRDTGNVVASTREFLHENGY